jgi:hypothetical protein
MKKIIKSWTTGPTHNGWLIETADGNFEVWMEGISFHPSKSREYPAVLVETISADEVARRDEAADNKAAEIAVIEEAATDKRQTRQEWVNTLPGTVTVGSETLTIDSQSFEVTDNYGNFLFPLPTVPVDDFLAWVEQEFNNFLDNMGGE